MTVAPDYGDLLHDLDSGISFDGRTGEAFTDSAEEAMREAAAAIRNLVAEREGLVGIEAKLREALAEIAVMTDADNPDSYRADDREGCLDAVHDAARAALSGRGKA